MTAITPYGQNTTTDGTTFASSTPLSDIVGGPSPTTVAAAVVGILLVVVSFLGILFYFTRYKYNRFNCCKKLRTRTWSSGSYSHNPLEPDDTGTTELPTRTDRRFFSITENDDDGFIYDEIFDASQFVDQTTRKSIRNLYSPTKTTEDVPDLNLRI